MKAAGKIRNLMSKYQEVELLVRIGEYKKGSDAAADEAISKIDSINNFLKQGLREQSSFDQTLQAMIQLAK
jgi:type III secretion protein N (ATPase)